MLDLVLNFLFKSSLARGCHKVDATDNVQLGRLRPLSRFPAQGPVGEGGDGAKRLWGWVSLEDKPCDGPSSDTTGACYRYQPLMFVALDRQYQYSPKTSAWLEDILKLPVFFLAGCLSMEFKNVKTCKTLNTARFLLKLGDID